eukprot:SAG11_NODE_858_length_6850_cov_11.886535_6_plen_90_part_00
MFSADTRNHTSTLTFTYPPPRVYSALILACILFGRHKFRPRHMLTHKIDSLINDRGWNAGRGCNRKRDRGGRGIWGCTATATLPLVEAE